MGGFVADTGPEPASLASSPEPDAPLLPEEVPTQMADLLKADSAAVQNVAGEVSFAGNAPAGPMTLSPVDCSWHAFLRFCKQRQDLSALFSGMLRTLSGEWQDNALMVTPQSEFCMEQLRSPETNALFSMLVHEYYGPNAGIVLLPPPSTKTPAELKEELREHPAVRLLEEKMGARLIDYGIVHHDADTRLLQ